MRKSFLLVCIVLVGAMAYAQNYPNLETRWGLQPGGVVMSPPPPYPMLMTTPNVALDNGMPRPVTVIGNSANAPAANASEAGKSATLSLGAATFSTAYDLSGRRADLAKVAAELKQNRPARAARTYTNSDIAALKPPKPLSH